MNKQHDDFAAFPDHDDTDSVAAYLSPKDVELATSITRLSDLNNDLESGIRRINVIPKAATKRRAVASVLWKTRLQVYEQLRLAGELRPHKKMDSGWDEYKFENALSVQPRRVVPGSCVEDYEDPADWELLETRILIEYENCEDEHDYPTRLSGVIECCFDEDVIACFARYTATLQEAVNEGAVTTLIYEVELEGER